MEFLVKNLKLKTKNFPQQLLVAFISGTLMGCTVAPVGAWFLAWFALAPLWVLVVEYCQNNQTDNSVPTSISISKSQQGISAKNQNLTSKSKKADVTFELNTAVKQSHPQTHSKSQKKEKLFSLPPLNFYLLPLLWGIGYYGVSLSWISGLHPLTWLGVPWVGSIAIAFFSWSFITLWGVALVTMWALVMRLIAQATGKSPIFPLTQVIFGTALWCLLEGIWGAGPLWWSSLSYTQSPNNLVILHLGQVSGANAVTAAIVAVNGLIAQGLINRKNADSKKNNSPTKGQLSILNNYFLLATILFVSLHIIGFLLYNQPISKTPETGLKIGIVQGNIPNKTKFDFYGLRRAIQGYTSGYEKLVAQNVDAVLTPEGALPFFSEDIKNSSLVTAVKEKGIVAWIGGFAEQGESRYTNSLFTFTGNGEIFSKYGKHKLVPLGEYVPFEEFLGSIINRLSPVRAKQIPGKPNQIFETPFGRGIAGICYESAFPEIFRYQAAMGGQFIITASNNDPYSAAMQTQHHAQDIMRAIETDRWAARATNTGLSAFVDPHGKTLWMSGHKTYEAHAETIYRRQTQTLYVRWGDWLTPSLLGLSIFLLGLQYRLRG